MDFQEELVAEYDREVAKTRNMLVAIPEDVDLTFKPSPKSMVLGRLAGHVAETSGDWALHTLTMDKLEFAADHKWEPYIPTSIGALLQRFDHDTAQVKEALRAFDTAKWDSNWKFVASGQTWIDEPRFSVWRNWVMNHLIHHRAQLGVYLRVLGKPIPGTYGPSADEM